MRVYDDDEKDVVERHLKDISENMGLLVGL